MKKMNISFRAILLALIIGFVFSSWALAADHTKWKKRPIVLGVSGSNIEMNLQEEICSAGTLGSLVKRTGADGVDRFFILSNNHVLARTNKGERGELILQPGDYDDDCLSRRRRKVAKLTRFIPIRFSKNNKVDAAIARVIKIKGKSKVREDGKILGIRYVSNECIDPKLNMRVKKAGRTTGRTVGKITAIGCTINVGYFEGTARFVDQIQIEGLNGNDFSLPGDSGSLIVKRQGTCPNPVGLLFAGSTTQPKKTYANPIAKVYSSLNVEPVGCDVPENEMDITGDMEEEDVLQDYEENLKEEEVEVDSVLDDDEVDNALQIMKENEAQLLASPKVVGMGVGLAEGEVVIKVYLEEETYEAIKALPYALDGFRVVPEVTGKIIPY